jgi:hypothetical protein
MTANDLMSFVDWATSISEERCPYKLGTKLEIERKNRHRFNTSEPTISHPRSSEQDVESGWPDPLVRELHGPVGRRPKQWELTAWEDLSSLHLRWNSILCG